MKNLIPYLFLFNFVATAQEMPENLEAITEGACGNLAQVYFTNNDLHREAQEQCISFTHQTYNFGYATSKDIQSVSEEFCIDLMGMSFNQGAMNKDIQEECISFISGIYVLAFSKAELDMKKIRADIAE